MCLAKRLIPQVMAQQAANQQGGGKLQRAVTSVADAQRSAAGPAPAATLGGAPALRANSAFPGAATLADLYAQASGRSKPGSDNAALGNVQIYE